MFVPTLNSLEGKKLKSQFLFRITSSFLNLFYKNAYLPTNGTFFFILFHKLCIVFKEIAWYSSRNYIKFIYLNKFCFIKCGLSNNIFKLMIFKGGKIWQL